MPIIARRKRLIEQFGGACQRCGYNKSLRALHFHHLDPSDKYNWAIGKGRASVNEIEQHPERFEMVCANCHAEIHDEMDNQQFVYAICKFCGKQFRTQSHRAGIGRGKYCSRKCFNADRDKYAVSRDSYEKRFWKHVEKSDGCWFWRGQMTANGGYPYLQVKQPNGKYTIRLAHRISYQIHFGDIPRGGVVIRTCGVANCVNPNHLQLKR